MSTALIGNLESLWLTPFVGNLDSPSSEPLPPNHWESVIKKNVTGRALGGSINNDLLMICCSFWLLFFGCNVNHGFWWQTCVSRIFAHTCTIFTHVDGTWLYMPSCSKCIVCWWPQIFFWWSQGTFSISSPGSKETGGERADSPDPKLCQGVRLHCDWWWLYMTMTDVFDGLTETPFFFIYGIRF